MIKYISIVCLFFCLNSLFGIDRDTFNLVKPVVQSVPSNWIKTQERGEVDGTWYHCPTNNIEWRYVAPFYIETRRVTTLPVRVPQINYIPQMSFSSGSC